MTLERTLSDLQAFDSLGRPILKNITPSLQLSSPFWGLSTIELILRNGGGDEFVFDCFFGLEWGRVGTILLSGMQKLRDEVIDF